MSASILDYAFTVAPNSQRLGVGGAGAATATVIGISIPVPGRMRMRHCIRQSSYNGEVTSTVQVKEYYVLQQV